MSNTASPTPLGAVVWSGVDGIRRKRTLPAPPSRDFWEMSDQERAAAGVRPLPRSLGEALDRLAACAEAREWFGDRFFEVYLQFKRAELRVVEGLDDAEICARYAEIY
jgi:glutamine synthetase